MKRVKKAKIPEAQLIDKKEIASKDGKGDDDEESGYGEDNYGRPSVSFFFLYSLNDFSVQIILMTYCLKILYIREISVSNFLHFLLIDMFSLNEYKD